VAFTPDGQAVLSGSVDKTVRVWDVTTGRQARVLSCNAGVRHPLAADSRLAVAGTLNGQVWGWSLDTGAERFVLEAGREWLGAGVSVSADGRWLASGTNAKVKVWKVADLANKDATPSFEKQTPAGWLAFEKDSNKLWTAEHGGRATDRACCWDPASGQLVSSVSLRTTSSPWMVYALSPDSRMLAAFGAGDRVAQLYDTRTGKPHFADPGHTRAVHAVAFSADGRRLASGGADNTVRVWDLATATPKHTLTGHTAPVESVAFRPDGTLLASGSQDGTIALWDIASGTRLHTLNGFCRESSVRFSPDGKLVAAGTADGGMRLWFARSGEEARTLPGLHQGLVRCLAFSADGRHLASGGADGKVVITELAGGKVMHSFQRKTAVCAVDFAADGETVVAGYAPPEPVVRLWSLKDKDFLSLKGPADRISSVALRPDGRLAVATSLDGSVRLWEVGGNLPRKMVLAVGSAGEKLVVASLSPDGRHVAAGSTNGTIHLYRLPSPAENIGEWLSARGSPPPGLPEAAWLARVGGLSVGNALDAVADRLRELNPGFDGKMEYKVEGGQVVGMALAIDRVKDISPLRALPGLRKLDCKGTWWRNGKLADLTPLQGMKLTQLSCFHTQVADLAVVKGMPLTTLECVGTGVTDLSPVKGMPLTSVNISYSPVSDLSPLEGMRLTKLECWHGAMTDASLMSLRGMSSLRELQISGTNVTDAGFVHLKDLTGLERLNCGRMKLTGAGLVHLKGLPRLQWLGLFDTQVTDAQLAHVQGMHSLRMLELHQAPVTDAGLEHLTGLKNLAELRLHGTAVTDAGIAKLKAALPRCNITR
jgi:WD40 repeat protein/Leucine-rich repeat (LRR) protein